MDKVTSIFDGPDGLAEIASRLDSLPPKKSVQWAFQTFGKDLVLAASFQDIVLIDIAHSVDPDVEVVFLDTEAHFEETLSFVEEIKARYSLNLTVTHPGPDKEEWPCGSEKCCQVRKVAPLRKVLSTKKAWLTSLKRVDATTREHVPVVEWDENFGLVKINPLAAWTEEDITSYLADHDLPEHPLIKSGYLSIGCAPTTKPVAPGEDPRSGRFAGMGKTECGLHPAGD